MNYEYNYNSAHKWLAYHFGKANKCERCDTRSSSKYEYALLKGKKHEKKRENYIKLCAFCHKSYDGIIERLAEKKYKPVYAERNGKKYYFSSIKEASKEFGVLKTSISNNLKGLSKTAGGYIWTIA